MSKLRENVPAPNGDLESPAEGDLEPYAVFTQLNRGDPHIYAGGVDAADPQMALQFAREHYGQDQPCVNIWVVPKAAISATSYDHDLIWRHTDQSYRLARGYTADVRNKWKKIRARKDLAEYEKDDLKEVF